MTVKSGRVDFGVGEECGQHTVLSHQDAESPPIEVRAAELPPLARGHDDALLEYLLPLMLLIFLLLLVRLILFVLLVLSMLMVGPIDAFHCVLDWY